MYKMKKKRQSNLSIKILALLLSVLMIIGMMPMTAMAQQTEEPIPKSGQLLKQGNVEVKTIHGDGTQGDVLPLSFEQASGVFSGKLANYTDLKEYNDADVAVTLTGLPEGTTAQLKTESGEKIMDFVDGTAQTMGGAVSKKGVYTFVVSLQNGATTEDYTLKLEKVINTKWSKLFFAGIPAFDAATVYHGAPEGTLFQLNEKGERTGKTGLSEDCFNYEVYVSAVTKSVKPAGAKAIDIFKSSFSYPNYKASVYIDETPLFENVPTCMAMVMKWSQLAEGVKLINNRTALRVEFKFNDKVVVNTKINFVIEGKMDSAYLIAALEALKLEELVWPADSDDIKKLYQSFVNLSDEEKAKISQELQDKLNKAYEIMRDDRVPSKLEIKKPAAKLIYASGQTFDATGAELLATYPDGRTRTITAGFGIEPTGPLTNEREVAFIYNTVRVTQPIRMIGSEGSLEGEGTQNNPYKLTNAKDMQKLYDIVASGQSTEGKYYEMTANITLPDVWNPIGITKDGTNDIQGGANLYAFSGIIDGKNHTLTVPEGGLPLLGYVKGAEVRNLNIYGKKIAGYGLVNNLEGVKLSGTSIIIDNVTLKSGSATLKSGLLGANITTNGFAGCSAGFVATVRNCTIEKGVIIGYDKSQSMIGSIAGRMQGTVENCVSYATVYGGNYVGGIIGTRDNAMGEILVTNCEFGGVVEASGTHTGGILGGGYSNSTAPNGGRVPVIDCSSSGKITGKNKVGGIMGADSYVLQSWGQNSFKNNKFTGTVKATDGQYVGGVIGYLGSLNKYDGFNANYYAKSCGAEKGIGFVQYVDTSCETHETKSGAIYFNSSVALPGVSGIPLTDHNRTDDPLGTNAVMLTYSDDNKDPIAIELNVSGEYKTSYLVGEALDFSRMKLTVAYHTGETRVITLNDVEIKNYDPNKRGTQTVSLVYGPVSAQIEVTVSKPDTGKVTVYISVLGDTKHGADSKENHTLAGGNLTTWVKQKAIEVGVNDTVLAAIEKAIEGEGITLKNPSGNYIVSLTKNGVELAELDNGPNSGWMYTLNGMHPKNGVSEQFLEDGDEIILHYSDDYTKESPIGSEDDTRKLGKLQKLLAALPDVDKLKLTDAAAVSEAMDLYNSLTNEGKAAVSKENKDKLNAAVQKIEKLMYEARGTFEEAYKKTGSYLHNTVTNPTVSSIGGEWAVLGLSRSEFKVNSDYYNKYLANVINTLKENNGILHNKKYTEYSRVILGLTSIGYDVTNVAGYNLLAPLADYDKVIWQGINGPIWALIALDSHSYEIPKVADGKKKTSRDELIKAILNAEVPRGGWTLSGNNTDPDMTGMALQALAPYYNERADVKAAVDRALTVLSNLQNNTGGFGSWGTVNCESCAQVIMGLTSLGINPNTDERFIKNGRSVLDAMLDFAASEGGFKHVINSSVNGMATEQGYQALTAYYRFLNGKNSIYNMNDIVINDGYRAVVELINAIGRVGLNSGDTIYAARNAYDALTEAQKNQVTNYKLLLEAEAQYGKLTVNINKVKNLIDSIEAVTLGSEDKVSKARKAYDGLTEAEKLYVTNYEILTRAETKLTQLKNADKVMKLIDAIGSVTKDSGAAIEAARNAYNALSSWEKALVTNYSALTTAERVYGELMKPTPKPENKPSGDTSSLDSGSNKDKIDVTVDGVKYNVSKEVAPVIEQIAKMPKDEKYNLDEVLTAYKLYIKLTEKQKAEVVNYSDLEAKMNLIGVDNHQDKATGIKVDGLEWYIKMSVKKINSSEASFSNLEENIGSNKLLNLWDFTFKNLLDNNEYHPEEKIKVSASALGIDIDDNLMIIHCADDGRVEYIDYKIENGEIVWEAKEFSLYGIISGVKESDLVLSEEDKGISTEKEEKNSLLWLWIVMAGIGTAFILYLIIVRTRSSRGKESN